MATFDSPWCLTKFNDLCGRPPADAITDVRKYGWLTEANSELVSAIAAVCPWTLYPTGAFPTLSTVDNNIFTFGTDSNGSPITPIGKTGIYTDLASIPDWPWREGSDYLNEGSQIRIPNGNTYSGTLYWRGITQPADLDANHNPTLLPEASRQLIPHIAALNFARSFARNPDLAQMELDFLGYPWAEKTNGAFARWCLAWKTAFKSGGALPYPTGDRILVTTGVGSTTSGNYAGLNYFG